MITVVILWFCYQSLMRKSVGKAMLSRATFDIAYQCVCRELVMGTLAGLTAGDQH